MESIVLFYLLGSLLLYILFAGADFGAGILELLSSPEEENDHQILHKTLGPIWEANHIWILIAIVIAFVAYPALFARVSIQLHIPIVCILLGILLRGSAFAFHLYDPIPDRSHALFRRIYAFSSLWTAFWFGVTASAFTLGRLQPQDPSFYSQFLAPWLSVESGLWGVFTVLTFAFLAAVYSLGELPKPSLLLERWTRRARTLQSVLILSGALLLGVGALGSSQWTAQFFASKACLAFFAAGTVFQGVLWRDLARGASPGRMRIWVAATVSCVLLGWYAFHSPGVLPQVEGPPLALHAFLAPPAVLRQLVVALVLGTLLFLPALVFLYRLFQKHPED